MKFTARPLGFIVQLIVLSVGVRRSIAQNPELKCDLPANIDQLPEFAQDEIRAVWKNYVPGDDCKKELLITDDILAVLDMFDKELEKNGGAGNGASKMGPLITTQNPQQHETLITDAKVAIDVETSPPTLATILSSTHSIIEPTAVATEEDVDYSEFTTTAAPTKNSTPNESIPQTAGHKSTESSEQPFSYTGSPSAALTSELTTTPRLELDYAEPLDSSQEAVTSKAVRITRVRIPTDYEDYNHVRSHKTPAPRRNDLRLEKSDKVLNNEKFYESQEPAMPFLKGASPQVVRLFKEVMADPDVVSEQRRQEEVSERPSAIQMAAEGNGRCKKTSIHLLAVSYLNSKQLSAFNTWSSQRRKRIRAREQVLQPLSFVARDALKRLSLTPSDHERKTTAYRLPGEVRDELRAFAIRLREQHEPDYRHKHA